MAEPAVEAAKSKIRLECRAASTTSMTSVMPGRGSGTKDESTRATKKRPKRPKLNNRRKSAEWGRCARWASSIVAALELAMIAAAIGVIPDKTRMHDGKSRKGAKKGCGVAAC